MERIRAAIGDLTSRMIVRVVPLWHNLKSKIPLHRLPLDHIRRIKDKGREIYNHVYALWYDLKEYNRYDPILSTQRVAILCGFVTCMGLAGAMYGLAKNPKGQIPSTQISLSEELRKILVQLRDKSSADADKNEGAEEPKTRLRPALANVAATGGTSHGPTPEDEIPLAQTISPQGHAQPDNQAENPEPKPTEKAEPAQPAQNPHSTTVEAANRPVLHEPVTPEKVTIPSSTLRQMLRELADHKPTLQTYMEPPADMFRKTSAGEVPIINESGRVPWQVFSRPFEGPQDAMRIGVIVTGLGLDSLMTSAAINGLPADVALSFSPYAPKLAEQVHMARRAGHEIYLDLPMEPESFPARDPGPLGMLTIFPPTDNLNRLMQVMATVRGYVGLVPSPPEVFASSSPHMRPILERIAHHGLLYIDSTGGTGTVPNRDTGITFMLSDVRLESETFNAAVTSKLEYIEKMAAHRGRALIVVEASPLTMFRLNEWSNKIATSKSSPAITIAPPSSMVPR